MTNVFLYAATVLIWGSTWLPLKLQLGVVPPEVSIVYRFLAASLLLFAWCGWRGLKLSFGWHEHVWFVLLGAFLFGLNYLGFYLGSAYLTSGIVALVFSLIVVLNIAFSALFFGRRTDGRVLVGAGLGLAGIAVTFWKDIAAFDAASAGSLGLALCVGATVSASLGNMVATRNHKARLPVLPATAFGMAYGTALMGLYAVAKGSPFILDHSPIYLFSLAYLALFGSVLGFGFYLTLLGRIGPERASYASVLFPVVALALSMAFEDYRWDAPALAGAALVLAGNLLVLTPNPVRRRAVA